MRRDGYTLIEVMLAVAVLTVGTVGIYSLQEATTRGNGEARETTTATMIARTWIERMRLDALRWTTPLDLSRTVYLNRAVDPAAVPDWFAPVPPAGVESYAFDYQGRDVLPADATRRYCANARMQWVFPGQAIRADVRVWWPRRQHRAGRGQTPCNGNATAISSTDPALHYVFLSTVLRWTARP